MAEWDLIIVGAGAVGAAAARRAGEAGARTLVLEFAVPGHDKGSSHGPGRIFRHAYFEHPDYVPLLRHATARIEQLEDEEGVELLHRCGVLLMGDERSDVVTRSIDAASRWNVEIETLDGWTLSRRFPWFDLSPWRSVRGVFERNAGLVRPEKVIAASLASATRRGVVVRLATRVLSVGERGMTVTVTTDEGTFTARHAIVAAGAWTSKLVPELERHLRVTRQVQAWVAPNAGAHAVSLLPCWLLDRGPDAPAIYGLAPDPLGTGTFAEFPKVAFHGSDILVDPDVGADPVGDEDIHALLGVYRAKAPTLAGKVVSASTCLYTMSPDGNFLVGRTPHHKRIHVAAGLSGHGFKLAPTLGDALAESALFGKTGHPVDFLSPDRFIAVG